VLYHNIIQIIINKIINFIILTIKTSYKPQNPIRT